MSVRHLGLLYSEEVVWLVQPAVDPERGEGTELGAGQNWVCGPREVVTYHVTVAGKHACREFIHIYTVIFCTVRRPLLVELAGIRTHCTPLQSAAKLNLESGGAYSSKADMQSVKSVQRIECQK